MPMNVNFAGGKLFQAIEAANERAFTRTTRPNQGNHFPFMYLEIDILKHMFVTEKFVEFNCRNNNLYLNSIRDLGLGISIVGRRKRFIRSLWVGVHKDRCSFAYRMAKPGS